MDAPLFDDDDFAFEGLCGDFAIGEGLAEFDFGEFSGGECGRLCQPQNG